MSRLYAICSGLFLIAVAAVGCSTSSDTCAQDDTVSGCDSPSIGYSCTGNDTPDQDDSSLICSYGITGNAGSTLYCCLPTDVAFSSCTQDDSVDCSDNAGPTFGFTCTGTDTPEDADPSLTCSDATPVNGALTYCCQ